MLERGISLRELARLKTDRLLEEEVEDGSQAVQIMGMDPHVDRQGLAAQLAKIKVALGRCVIQDGVQPQIQATREGLADRARRDRRQVDDVIERAHALGREGPGAAVTAL